MNAEIVLQKVITALDALVKAGEEYGGMWPSLLSLDTAAMLRELPPPIPGQRNSDRAHLGSNLIHDQTVLQTMYALADYLGQPAYARAADRYLQRFATHCANTETGLFPWGEHAFWHLGADRLGNSIAEVAGIFGHGAVHDHLRQAPLWLWEKLQRFNPGCVERFAAGLDYHWQAGEPPEYIRHAPIASPTRSQRRARSCDFPRHSGFYLFDLAFAFLKTGRGDFLEQLHKFLDYWWIKRDPDGLLKIESRSPQNEALFAGVLAPGQTISLATSLLETAQLLAESQPALAAEMRPRAVVYINGFFAAPHDLEKGIFRLLYKRDDDAAFRKAWSEKGNPGPAAGSLPIWRSQYGIWPAAYVALVCLCAHRLTGDARLLQWARAVGASYRKEPFPPGQAVPAMDAGLGLGLLADLYAVTGEKEWLEAGLKCAPLLIGIYLDRALPRGAAGIDWYESQMGPGFLLHSLARIALLDKERDQCPLAADYTAR